MSFNLTKGTISLVLISLISITMIAFMMQHASYYGVEVPEQYQGAFDNFDALQNEYGNSQQTIEQGEVDEAQSDLGVFTSAITAVRQLGNIGQFASSVLNDLALFLKIPSYWVQGLFVIVGILILSSIVAFFSRGHKP